MSIACRVGFFGASPIKRLIDNNKIGYIRLTK